MYSVGQLLKEERLKKGFTLAQVEKATKIRSKFLTAIEDDDYQKMPVSPYIQGFIKNYSDFLGLRTHTMLALFRRQFLQKEAQNKQLVEEPLTKPGWQITPNKVIFTLVVILVLALFTYFYNEYRALHQPPPLSISNPTTDQVVKEETIAVFGNTDSDATVTINNGPLLVKEDGKFYKDVSLTLGNNTLVIEATSRVGEKTTTVIRITRLANENSN
jgi:cytoskeletal protein RodZ